ncbi:MAG: tetratricopeptide (TPR) repeat protein, partial [Marinoscillum sp.]
MIYRFVNKVVKVCAVGIVYFGTSLTLFAQYKDLPSLADRLVLDTAYLAPIHTRITKELEDKTITYDSAANYYLQLADLVKERHDFTLSRLLIGKSFNHLKNSKNPPSVAKIHILLGEMANDEDEISSALSLFSMALDIYKEEQDSINYLLTLRKIGVAYDYIGDHETALQHYDECIELAKILGREDVIGNCYNTIAAISKEEGNYGESIAYFEKGIEIAIRIEDKILLGKLYHNISLPYQHLELFDEANHYLSLSMKLAQEIQDLKGIGFAYQGLGFMYFRKGQYDSSEYFMRKALELSHKINNMQLEANAREVLGEIFEETGRYKEAFENLQIIKVQDDSLYNQQNAQIIESIKGKYQAAKKDQELAETTLRLKDADFELRRQSIVQIALILVLSLTFIILFLIYRGFRMRQKANVMLVAKNAEIKKHVTQVEHLNQTKDRWFINVAHELRTPLTLIKGPLSRVLSQFELQPEVKSDLELVNKNAISLSNLVNEILDLSR